MHNCATLFAGLCAGMTGSIAVRGGDWTPLLIAALGWFVASMALNRLNLIRLVSVRSE